MTKDEAANASDDLFEVVLRNHGTAGRTWIEYLLASQASIKDRADTLTSDFMRRVDPGAGGVRRRMLQKAGLLYVAGKLATRAGILPLARGQAFKIARFAYDEFLACAFGQPDDVEQALVRLKAALREPEWVHRTDSLRSLVPDPIPQGILHGDNRLYIRDDRLASIISGDHPDPRLVSSVKAHLIAANAMLPGQGKKRVVTLRLGAEAAERRYLPFDAQRLRHVLGGH